MDTSPYRTTYILHFDTSCCHTPTVTFPFIFGPSSHTLHTTVPTFHLFFLPTHASYLPTTSIPGLPLGLPSACLPVPTCPTAHLGSNIPLVPFPTYHTSHTAPPSFLLCLLTTLHTVSPAYLLPCLPALYYTTPYLRHATHTTPFLLHFPRTTYHTLCLQDYSLPTYHTCLPSLPSLAAFPATHSATIGLPWDV